MKSITWYLYFGISVVFKYFDYKKCLKVKGKIPANEYRVLVNATTSKWAATQVKNSGANITVIGEENIPDENVLFVSNHQGNFDIAVFMACIKKDKGFVSKVEMLKLPIIRKWMLELECVFLDRSDIKKSAKTIIECINILKSGYSMVVFPEGTRSQGPKVGEFKGGSFKLATKSKVPIVPVTIDGTYKLMERNNNKIKPADVRIVIHEPISTIGITKEEERDLPEKVRKIISDGIKD